MRLLLDTHAALWVLNDDARLPTGTREQIVDGANVVLLSAAVVWEVAIKRALGKLDAPAGWTMQLLTRDFDPLPVTLDHAAAVEALPPHHRDPFDRMLVAQARVEGAAIVSRDPVFTRYDVPVVW